MWAAVRRMKRNVILRMSFCGYTWVRVTVWSMHSFHASLSKAKNGSTPDFVTGGSWKKSPVTTSY